MPQARAGAPLEKASGRSSHRHVTSSQCHSARDWTFAAAVVGCGMGERGERIRIIAAIVGVTCGCSSSPPPEAAAADLNPSGARSECLAPPWTPAGSSPGLRVSQCEDKRVYRIVLGDGAPASDDAQSAFLNAHRAAFHAVDGIVESGNGLCCLEDLPDPAELCVVFELRLCSTPLPKFIETVRKLQAADSGVADHALRIAVELQGPTAPRCEADDNCGRRQRRVEQLSRTWYGRC